MALDPAYFFYAEGTITLTNGSDLATGDLVAWDPAVLPFDFVFPNNGSDGMTVIKEVLAVDQIRLAKPWTGPTLTGVPYFMVRWANHIDPRFYAIRVSEYLARLKAIPENFEEVAAQVGEDAVSVATALTTITTVAGEVEADRQSAAGNASDAAGSAATATQQAVAAKSEANRAASYVPASVAASISGLNPSMSSTNPLTHLNISPGTARDASNTVNIVLAAGITKRLDQNWAAGNNAGGLDTGTRQAGSHYHIHLIRNPTSGAVDILFSLSPTAPVMPSGYTQRRRIGAVPTWANGEIYPAVWFNGWCHYKQTSYAHISGVDNTAVVLRDVFMPKGIKVLAKLYVFVQNASATGGHIVASDPDVVVPVLGGNMMPGLAKFARFGQNATFEVQEWTDTSGRLYFVDTGGAGSILFVYPKGWYDHRDEYA